MDTQSSYWRYCATPEWQPSVNVCESPDGYHVCVDLAGMRREDIDVQVHQGHLVIRGQRSIPRPDTQTDQVRMHHMEIQHGPFCRQLDLPDDVDPQAITARYKDGVLWIWLPKHVEQAQP